MHCPAISVARTEASQLLNKRLQVEENCSLDSRILAHKVASAGLLGHELLEYFD